MLDRIHIALRDFPGNPELGLQALRALREENVSAFRDGAFSLLFESDTSPGHKDMIRLVRESGGDFLPRLVDPSLPIEQAVQGIQSLCRAESGVDVRLVRMLIHPSIADNPRAVGRVLDILEQLPAMPRMVPILMQVYRVAAKQVRARIATMIGRTHRNEEWVDQRLSDADSRVRANIVELYIGHASHLAIDVFRRGIVDSAPRVIANAALGLYYAASVPTLQFLGVQMAGSESANERAAAAWAMGQTRDPRFRVVLSRLIRDKDPMVRRQSIRALTILRREEAAILNGGTAGTLEGADAHDTPPGIVTIRSTLQFRSPTGKNHYELTVHRYPSGNVSGNGYPLIGVRPIEVHTYESNEPLFEYELHESDPQQLPGIYTVAFPTRFPGRETPVAFHYRAHSGDYKPA